MNTSRTSDGQDAAHAGGAARATTGRTVDGLAPRYLRGIDTTLRATAVGALLLLAVWVLQDILLLVFAALLIACMLRGASNEVHRLTGLGQGWSLFAVVATLLVITGLLMWWRGPQIADEATRTVEQIASQAQRLWQSVEQGEWGPQVAQQIRDAARSARESFAGFMAGVANSTLGIASSLVVVVATGLFAAASPEVYVGGFLRLCPPSWRPRGQQVMDEVGQTLQRWFVGQLLDMVVVTLMTGIGLYALGVPLAGSLAVFAGLLNFVPYVGALAGAVPAVLVALAQSPELALWVALLLMAVQMLEGNVIAPLIQDRTVSLPPALTILSQTLLGTLFGVLGLVLATPLMAAALTAVRMVYVESILERDDDDTVSGIPEQAGSPGAARTE